MELAGLALITASLVAFGASVASFFLGRTTTQAAATRAGVVDDVTKLIEAITKLVEALQKAGPAIALLATSIFFAALGTSLLTVNEAKSAPPAATTTSR